MLLRGNETKYPRESGILLHITSLPSPYGIGSLGSAAYDFVDFLKKTNQTYWQILPLCPVGRGNSPYSSVSSFAGEPLLIDIDALVNEGLLSSADITEDQFPQNVDYKRVRDFKMPLITRAAKSFNRRDRDFKDFRRENAYWLHDYALFSVLRAVTHKKSLTELDDGLKYRLPNALKAFKTAHAEEIALCEIIQYFFFKQYMKLKNYANNAGIKIIGDIPFYVQLDSADVWSSPDLFKLGRDMTPVQVAGVPPDIFSENGQLWGNPVYDWDAMKASGYDWWKKRLAHNAKLYDVIRIDHFRAFADYYTVPYGAENAKSGKWEKGAGIGFWNIAKPAVSAEIIAEDLGGDTPEVKQLVEDTGFPNMKILQFAFDSDLENQFLPKNYNKNCVCYTGTHDNDTVRGWFEKATQKEKIMFSGTIPADKSNSAVLSLIAAGMRSRARIVIIPMQDWLELDSAARMNTPGIPYGNWEWRMSESDITDELISTVKRLTSGRNVK